MGSVSLSESPFDINSLLKDKSLLETRGFIGGEWIAAPNGKTFPVYEPSSGTVLLNCSDFTQRDFVTAIEVAHKAQRDFYATTTAKTRGSLLREWNDLVLSHIDDLAIILSLENGKALSEARGEIVYAASFISWFAEEATRNYGDTIPSSYQNSMVITVKEPVGVCGIITPWNFPAAMITRKLAPAIAAGCAVVVKPPSETPFSALALAKLAVKAGMPSGLIHVVPTKDRAASLELVVNPKVKKISFTGSTAVGKLLTEAAAKTMKRVSMELGGNAPFIVFEDANLDLAIEGVLVCKFRSSGQTCVCANRILVHENVVEAFTEKLEYQVRKMKLGRGIDESTTHGPLANAAAVQKVHQHVDDAVRKGAVVRIGGSTPRHLEGYFFEPTVITGATADMQIASDETFGPVAAIFSFKTEDEAIELANNTEFGLAGYFYSRNMARVIRVSQRLQCGMVGVNTGLMSAAETPFGGINESGVGREGSKYGLAEYQNIKAITIGNNQDQTLHH